MAAKLIDLANKNITTVCIDLSLVGFHDSFANRARLHMRTRPALRLNAFEMAVQADGACDAKGVANISLNLGKITKLTSSDTALVS